MSALSPEARALAGRAGDYINVHGWCQGDAVDESGGVCLIGGVEHAGTIGPTAVVEELLMHLRREVTVRAISVWNDDPSRTQSEVVGVLFAVEEGWL
jgi:hypothetical protein